MLTKENEKAVEQLIDDLIVLSGIWESLSDLGIKIGVGQLDKQVFDKINPIYENVVNEIITASLIDKDYDLAIDKLSVLLADVVNTPLVDGTPEEIALYHNGLDFIKTLLIHLKVINTTE